MTNIYDNCKIKIFEGDKSDVTELVNKFLADDSHIVIDIKYHVVDHYYVTHCVMVFYKEV